MDHGGMDSIPSKAFYKPPTSGWRQGQIHAIVVPPSYVSKGEFPTKRKER